ncbi:MAG: TonB-dependent receptor [Agriterribacter sp.]
MQKTIGRIRNFTPKNLLKTLLIMKFLSVFLLIAGLQVSGRGFSQNVTLAEKNISLVRLFHAIERQTGYSFFYDESWLQKSNPVTISVKDIPLEKALEACFENQPLTYSIVGKTVVIKLKEKTVDQIVPEQTTTLIKGIVTSQEGQPLPGVSVVIEATQKGTTTDDSGKFSINANSGDVLVFSMIGYKTSRYKASASTTINIKLEPETTEMNDVVVIGYGTQKKSDVTGAIVSVKGADLVKSPSPNLASSLTGRLPGVIINNRSGEPGYDDPTIFVRGKSTTGNADPLVIIDGVERSGLSRLNPNDIDNITVLKDASAAIYGARAANGVILVTTKRGKPGKPQFEVSFNQGYTRPTRTLEMTDSYTFANVTNEYRAAQGLPPLYTDDVIQKYKDGSDPENYPNTDWQKLMTKELAPVQKANIAVSGGSEKFKYFVSLGGLNQASQYNYGSEKYKQYNFRSNIDVKVSNHFQFGFDLSGRLENRHRPYNDAATNSSHIMLELPMWTLRWPGTDYLYPLRGSWSLVNMVSDNTGYENVNYKGITSTLSFKLDIPWVKGLWVDGTANYDAGFDFSKKFYIPAYVYLKDAATGEYINSLTSGASNSSLTEYFDQSTGITVNAKVNFKRNFGWHNIEAMAGYEQRQTDYDYLNAYRNNFISSALPELFAGSSVKSDQGNDGRASATARKNFFGRASYDYAGKYMAQAIFRYDGSQNFARGNRYGFFPGFSLGWMLSNESFMKAATFINKLKIRASYGEMGNDQVSAYQYMSSYSYNASYGYVIGGSDISGLTQSNVPNPDITWEVAKTSNIGLESTLWNELLGIEFDVFKTRRSNILTTRNAVVPDYTGLSLPNENVGIVENKGFELQLSHTNNKHAVKYYVAGNFSFARNKVIFSDEQPAAKPYQLATGRPMGAALYYKAIGIYKDQVQIDKMPHMPGAQPGDIIYKDIDGNGTIDGLDQIRINETNVPEIVYGLNMSVSYKNFDLSVLFQGQANANYYSAWLARLNSDVGNFFAERAKGRWTPGSTDATMPRNEFGGNNNRINTTLWLYSAGFLRLKNVELGYNLSQKAIDRLKIQGLRVYLSGFNLFYVFDHLKPWGIDPEANNTTWYYSQQRVFNMGFALTF